MCIGRALVVQLQYGSPMLDNGWSAVFFCRPYVLLPWKNHGSGKWPLDVLDCNFPLGVLFVSLLFYAFLIF